MKRKARIARSGIQYYLAEELEGLNLREVPREYRGQRVFSVYRPSFVLEAAADKFQGKPVRVGHQWVESASDPAIIGHVCGDTAIRSNGSEVALCATLDIDDGADLPRFKELSPGYLSRNEWRPGVSPSGEEYEILCTDISGVNHLAIVEEARGGKDMKILDGGRRLMVHSGLIRAIKRRMSGVFDSKARTFEGVLDECAAGIKEMDEEALEGASSELASFTRDLPDSEEKDKLLRYVADIPLLKEEDDAVAREALECIRESYRSLDADAASDVTEKPMEEEKKEEVVEEKNDAVPAPEEKKEDGFGDQPPADAPSPEEQKEDSDPIAKVLDALGDISRKLDSLCGSKEGACDKEPEEVKEEVDDGCGKVSDSLPPYTQTLGAIEKGYSLDEAFNKLKTRRA